MKLTGELYPKSARIRNHRRLAELGHDAKEVTDMPAALPGLLVLVAKQLHRKRCTNRIVDGGIVSHPTSRSSSSPRSRARDLLGYDFERVLGEASTLDGTVPSVSCAIA